MRHKNFILNAFTIFKWSLALLIFIGLLFSCSESLNNTVSQRLVGSWDMVNIDQLNAVREKVEEKTMLGTNREVFDPVKKVNIEYYSDGTGNWEVESEYQAKSRHNFTYRFISKNEYLFISDIEKVTLKYKIL